MRKVQGWAMLAMGAALIPAAFCPGQTTPNPVQGLQAAAKPDAAPAIPVEDQASTEQVERLFQVMRVRQQTEMAIKQMSTMMQQQVAQGMKAGEAGLPDDKKSTAAQTEARQHLMDKFMDRAMHMYTVDEMLADMTPIYQRHISKEDVEAFIAFFSSSSGQHLLDQQPLIAREYMPVVMSRVQEKTKALTDEMKKEMDELNTKDSSDSKGAPKQ
jgi:hypothetical protein